MVTKNTRSTASKKSSFFGKKTKIFLGVVILLVIIRLILPYVVLHYANKTLATMNGYYGHINDIDLSLYRGAYTINDIYINKLDSASRKQTPFLSSQVIDLSVEWKSLFNKRLVGELEFMSPKVLFTKDKVEPMAVQKDTNDFRRVLDKFMPLKINRFEVNNGKIQYIDATTTPKVDIEMNNAHMLAQNLSSVSDSSLLPASVNATANVYKGKFNFNMKINPLADHPTYDMNAEVKNTNLPELNDFFKAYANFDVNKGNFGLYTEIAAKEGKFTGYIKPVIKDLDVLGPEDKKDTFFMKVWEALVGAAGAILKNPKEEQIATKIPIQGSFGETKVYTWYAIIDLLRNAFIQAIYPALDYQITIASVDAVKPEEKKGLIKALFKKSDDKQERKKERKQERREKRLEKEKKKN